MNFLNFNNWAPLFNNDNYLVAFNAFRWKHVRMTDNVVEIRRRIIQRDMGLEM